MPILFIDFLPFNSHPHSPPAAGRYSDMLPPPQGDNCFLPLGKKVSSTLQSMSFWRRAFLYGFRCQKVCSAVPLGRWHKRILCKWLLYDGEETLKSWKPMLNTIFALRGSSECSVQPNAHHFFVPSAKRHCREGLLTLESYMVKKCLRHFNLCPSGEGLSYKVKRAEPSGSALLAVIFQIYI